MSAFKGKVILITGASAGIGEGIALHFATLGASLALTGRNRENLNKVVEQCKKQGLSSDNVGKFHTDSQTGGNYTPPCRQVCTDMHTSIMRKDPLFFFWYSGTSTSGGVHSFEQSPPILAITGDINSETDRKTIVDDTIRKFGKVHVLINNAGMTTIVKISDATPEQYDELFNTNCRSHLFLTQLFLPHLVQTKGNVINISSICASCAMPHVGVYCMAKAALEMFTKCLALELAPKGVRVNAVSPASVVSMITRRPGGPHQDETKYKEYLESCNQIHPVGRVGFPSDVANSVEFLASDQSSFVTGQILCVDGGRSLVTQ